MSKSGKNKGGRPSKYSVKYCKKLQNYFDIEPYREVEVTHKNKKGDEWTTFEDKANDLPTIEGFARTINVSRDTVYEWIKRHKKFSDTHKKARSMQEHIWMTNSLKGLYNPAFTIFTGKNIFGWKDKTETDLTSKGKQIVGFNFIAPNGGNNPNNKT